MPVEEPPLTAADLRERIALAGAIADLRALSNEDQDTIIFSAEETTVLLRKSLKALQRARTVRSEAIKAGGTVPEDSLASLAPLPPEDNEKNALYPASSITAYWARRVKAAKAESDALGVSTSTLRGFQSWLIEGTPSESWPFSIQPDGRPMDMVEAIRARMLTGNAARLNIREFADRLAHAASKSFSETEADAIAAVSRNP